MNKLPFFHKAGAGNIRFNDPFQHTRLQRVSLFFLVFGVIIFFFILLARLFQLTIVKGEYYRRLSDDNRIRTLVIESVRGTIKDRKGIDLVTSTQANIHSQAERIIAPRTYHGGRELSHLIGYRQIADQESIDNNACPIAPKVNDKVGKKGVEAIFECELKGKNGGKLVELDAHGKYKDTVSVIPPAPGQTIELALDYDLQEIAYEKLKAWRGAVIALKPQTGEVLALVSTPSFSSQDFEDNNQEMITKYLEDPDKPLFNRATEATYPPGSIFKLVIAAAALEDKKIDADTVIVDNGIIKAGPLEFGNWYFLEYGRTDGPVNVVKGIKRSNDIFFYQIGDRVGPERIRHWAEEFGFGRSTKFPFEQADGLIPSPFWKEEVIGDRWYQGDNYNIAIGQGYLLVTPIQTAVASAVFANGGHLCQPQLLKDAEPDCRDLKLSQKTYELVREGMRQACAPGGTGWPLFDFRVRNPDELLTPRPSPKDAKEATASASIGSRRIEVGCKTGTSENSAASGLPHAWFTAFAPFDDPEIVVTVLVEESGQGSDIAAPIARDIFRSYFERSE